MSDNVEIEKELEQLLAEPSTDDRIVRMEANLEKLVDHVTCMSRAAMQVRASTVAIKEQIAQLSEIPRLIAEELRVGTSRKAHKKAEEIRCIVDSRLQMPRKAILLELQKIVSALGESQKMPDLLPLKESAKSADQIRNAAQREQNSRAHARRVGYESQMEQATGKHDRDVFQEAVPSPCMPSTSNNDAFRHAYQQLNAGDFAHVSYEAEFDPIRAGEGEWLENTPPGQVAVDTNGRYDGMCFQNSNSAERPPRTTELNASTSRLLQSRGMPPEYGSDHMGDMAHMFAAMALPDVSAFADPQGRKFDEFLRSFRLKYLRLGLSDEMSIHLLASKLVGYPKAIFKALPQNVKEGTFEDCVAALSDKFKENESAAMQVNVTNDLAGARLLRRGEEIGHYEPGISDGEPLECFNNMLEKTSPDSRRTACRYLTQSAQEG
ncbi:hypothetical protein Aduo_013062 [Ancylostoma duodenale]